MASTALGPASRRDLSSPWRHVDVVLVAAIAGIAAIGVAMVFSATKGEGPDVDVSFLVREIVFMAGGAVGLFVVSIVDYRRFFNWVWPIYGAVMFGLVAVLLIGTEVNGAKAWFDLQFFNLQPAEFGKLALILALAAMLTQWEGDIDLKRLGTLLAVAAAPIFLILLQPDLGMVLIYVAIVMGMLLVGGVRGRYIVALTVIGVAGIVVVLNSPVLAEYQKARLTAFADPESNVEATYNVSQSQTAIGNGGITGEGYGGGRQTQLGFVPEQQTDFIFTAVGEELGFVGAATLLALYGVVMWRIWRTALLARDPFGRLICTGVLSFLVFQVFENAGMTMGIMPVTGIPLPLVSYGGSSIATTLVALGLVLNVHMHRFR
ncbi:MAG: rod shape-determining protein RodA [Acidimicrobiales bacterium]|nr:rod shape-determining protein RodA [Acidimicrobiales bacterium]